MTLAQRLAWFVIAFFLAFALTLCFLCGDSHAGRLSLTERLVAVQPLIQSKKDEPVDADELASAIASLPKINADWAALILTVGAHESALAARIAVGQCKPDECDHGLAWGLFQSHKNKLNEDVWGSPDIRVQTIEAARALRSAFYRCNGKRPLPKDWVARTLNAYAGHSCDAPWSGLPKRLATFEQVRKRL